MTVEESEFPGNYYDPESYARSVPELFAYLRKELGDEVELLHDVHERLAPAQAVRMAGELEPYRLFFLEDVLPPDHPEWFRNIRQQSSTPLAMGELFNHPLEWRNLVNERLIDFIRCHISQIGGISPARKLAIQCEPQGIRTAWHGPPDCSPIGHAANIHLDISTWNFGIQEWCRFPDKVLEVFPGFPEFRNGRVYPNDKPGLGIEFDEKKGSEYPHVNVTCGWMHARLSDGSCGKP